MQYDQIQCKPYQLLNPLPNFSWLNTQSQLEEETLS